MQNRRKILITDDNATNIEILEEVLADKYQVTPARSGGGNTGDSRRVSS